MTQTLRRAAAVTSGLKFSDELMMEETRSLFPDHQPVTADAALPFAAAARN